MKHVQTSSLRTNAGEQRRPLIDKVSADLTKRIQEALKEGVAWLPTERELAVELGVSRTVLREATKRLESHGLLRIEHGRGLRVVDNLHHPLTRSMYLRLPVLPERLAQLGEVKLFLEPEIARLATLRHKPEDLAALKAINKGLTGATTTEEAVKCDADFHRALVRSTGNQILRLFSASLDELSRESRTATFGSLSTARLHASTSQHEKIITALERGDASGGAEAMREHIQHVIRHLEELAADGLWLRKRRRRDPLLDEVSEELLKKIQKASAKGRHRLSSERDLAVELGVSRTVIRETSKRLESDGLLRVEHGSGLRIVDHLHHPLARSISLRLPDLITLLEQLAEVRLLLEPEIARLAALRLKPEDFAALKALQKGLKETTSTEEAVTFDTDFHLVLVRAVGNEILRLLLEALTDLSRESRLTTFARFGTAAGHLQHEKIMASLERRDADGSAEAMREHIQDLQVNLERLRRSELAC